MIQLSWCIDAWFYKDDLREMPCCVFVQYVHKKWEEGLCELTGPCWERCGGGGAKGTIGPSQENGQKLVDKNAVKQQKWYSLQPDERTLPPKNYFSKSQFQISFNFALQIHHAVSSVLPAEVQDPGQHLHPADPADCPALHHPEVLRGRLLHQQLLRLLHQLILLVRTKAVQRFSLSLLSIDAQ